MAIRTVVTRGYGNGTFNGTIPMVSLRGYHAVCNLVGDFGFTAIAGIGWFWHDPDIDFVAEGVQAGMTLRVPDATPLTYSIQIVGILGVNTFEIGGTPNGGDGGSNLCYSIDELPGLGSGGGSDQRQRGQILIATLKMGRSVVRV